MMMIWSNMGLGMETPRFLIYLPSIQERLRMDTSCYVQLIQPWKISRILIRISWTSPACTTVRAGINIPITYLACANWKKAQACESRFGTTMPQERGNTPQPMGWCLYINVNTSLLWNQGSQHHAPLPVARLLASGSIEGCMGTSYSCTNTTSRGRWRQSVYRA